ncbi:MAG: NADH-quinone oxidoreductase subunit C [Acidimicrobiales bacterium]|jgi:NADH-quinone oxidoreductase subunit C|nr:NADH-quinone oxidoreductase subunit C [Acidimicrobiales bacterium]HJM29230.1 NADH-quinone oxidoreductase subunit C [Acidimicrobiales bacterium]HJM97865.1 NADH-quinone oxidoreductase subunit C [Acidimicrobiales bacterium]
MPDDTKTNEDNDGTIPSTMSHGQNVLHPNRENLLEVIKNLREEGFVVCIDITAVDYLENPKRDLPASVKPERFEIVINLLSHTKRERLRLRVQIPELEPTLPTLFDIYPGSEALEREVHDLFGITFEGHPDMTRILMPENWEGHPLRKDYDIGKIPVQFKEAPGS